MNDQQQIQKAIEAALVQRWDAAHKIVQDMECKEAYWIHAILHKIEGDISNSRYWYHRAGVEFSNEDPVTELKRIQ